MQLKVRFRHCTAGLANEKTLHIEAGEENISVTRSHPKHANRPAQHKAKADKKGKNFRRTSRKLDKEVSSYRPDLKVSCNNFQSGYPCPTHAGRCCTCL